MTDDTTDSTPTDESDEGERATDPDGADHPPASKATPLEYDWRCTGCKARYDEKPERCERCGATEFVEFRDL